jgi:hypothetical protein
MLRHFSADRAARVRVQGALYRELVRRHGVTAITAEATSFNPPRFTMAVGVCASIGALTGVAAELDPSFTSCRRSAGSMRCSGVIRATGAPWTTDDVLRPFTDSSDVAGALRTNSQRLCVRRATTRFACAPL